MHLSEVVVSYLCCTRAKPSHTLVFAAKGFAPSLPVHGITFGRNREDATCLRDVLEVMRISSIDHAYVKYAIRSQIKAPELKCKVRADVEGVLRASIVGEVILERMYSQIFLQHIKLSEE